MHDAFEITVCFAASYAPSLTPRQIMTSASPLGAEMIDALRAALEVLGRLLACGEQAGRLDHDVDAVVAPRDLARLAGLELLDLAPVDGEPAVGLLDLVRDRPADGVVLEQERHRVRVAERVVHRHQLDAGLVAAGEDRPVERAADPAESVDPDSNGHVVRAFRWGDIVVAVRQCSGCDYSRAEPGSASLSTRPTSRWCTAAGYPARWSRSANCSAITTLRWRPPVQPTPIERYALPSCSYPGSKQVEQPVELVEELAGAGLLEHVVADGRVPTRERPQLLDPVRVREEAAVEHEVDVEREPVLVAERHDVHLQADAAGLDAGRARAGGPGARGR